MPLKFQAIAAIKRLLGFGPGKKPGQIGADADMRSPIGVFGDSQQDSGYNFYAREMQVAQERLQRYREFRNADDDDVISVAVDLYAEDATTINLDTGKSIWPTAKNPEVQKILDELFERIEVEDIAFPIAREIALMGDHFEGVILAKRDSNEPGGIVRLSALDPGGIHRHKDDLGRLAGFSIGVQPNEKGATAAPWEYIHWRLLGKERTTEYGWSMLASSRRVYRRLRMMEDALAIYRIDRCPDRLIFKMKGMAGLNPQERFRFLTSVRTYMRKKMAMDQEQGQTRSEVRPRGIDQDFYIDDDTIAIEPLHGTASVGPILDVDYMRKRLCGCLRIPSDYLGFPEAKGGFMSRSTLSDQDLQFSRQVKNLQRATITGFVRLCQIHLAWIGMDPKMEDNEFEIHMNPVSYLDELQRAELVRVRVETVNALQGLADKFPDLDKDAWMKFLFKVSGFPEDIIQKADEASKELGLAGNVEITEGQRQAAVLSRLLMGGKGSPLRNLLSDIAFSGSMSSKAVRADGVLPLPAVVLARAKQLGQNLSEGQEVVPLLEGRL